MKSASEPIKVYGQKSSLLLFVGMSIGVALIIFRHVGRELFDPLILAFVGVVALGLGIFVGFFAGRKTVYLFEDRLEVRGPLAAFAYRHLRISIWMAEIPYRDIVAVGQWAYETPRGSHLIVHQRVGSKVKKYGLGVVPLEAFHDFKRELLQRVPTDCKHYTTKG